MEIVKGILLGAFKAETGDISQCIKDAQLIYTDSKEAVHDFEQKNLKSMVAGLEMMGAAVMEIKPALHDCGVIKADLEKLSEMAAIMANPAALAYHVGKDLIVNGQDIYHEVHDSVNQFEEGKYQYFGYDIGMALAKLIIGEEEAMMEVDQSTLTLY